jgi:gas vesicle protein
MAQQNNNPSSLLFGALAGGLIVGAAIKFLSTSQGKKLKRNLTDQLDDYKDNVEDFIEDVADKIGNSKISKKTCEAVDCVKEGLEMLTDEENSIERIGLLGGALLCGLAGAGAAIYFANRPCEETGLRCRVKQMGSKAVHAKKILEELLEKVEARSHDAVEIVKSDTVRDVLDLAALGLQLWTKFKKKS